MKLQILTHRLIQASSGIRLSIAYSTLAGIGRVGCMLGFVWSSKRVIDIATNAIQGQMIVAVLILICAVVGEILFGMLATRIRQLAQVRGENTLRHKLFERLMQSRWQGIEKHHSGDLLNRLMQDVKDIITLLAESLPVLIVTGIQFIASFIFLMQLNSTLAWVLIVIMPLFLLLSKLYMRRMREMTHRIRNSDSRIQQVMQESLQNKLVIKTLERSNYISEQVGALQGVLHHQVKERTRFSLFSRTLISAGFAAGYLTAFIWGATELSQGLITFGVMTAFLQLVGQVQRPVLELAQLIPVFVSAITAIERIIEIEQIPAEMQGQPIKLTGSVGIHLQDLSFTYADNKREILHALSYDFAPGSSTAILGETGVGKSTLIRLMLALIEPSQGHVTIYNQTIRQEASPLTRCNFIYVPQGNTLFSGTIRDNLLLGNLEATEAQLMEVLHTAAADFVFALPEALETRCGEKGDGLSEGQAQRIAIARALLRSGGILLLDEASSALDPATQQLLLERIATIQPRKTILFITHRSEVAVICDQVLRLTPYEAESDQITEQENTTNQ